MSAQHSAAQHSTAQHSTAQHSTAQHAMHSAFSGHGPCPQQLLSIAVNTSTPIHQFTLQCAHFRTKRFARSLPAQQQQQGLTRCSSAGANALMSNVPMLASISMQKIAVVRVSLAYWVYRRACALLGADLYAAMTASKGDSARAACTVACNIHTGMSVCFSSHERVSIVHFTSAKLQAS